ncbi:DEAD/DEAH box helicase family protein, partial [Actinomadura adrarensis]
MSVTERLAARNPPAVGNVAPGRSARPEAHPPPLPLSRRCEPVRQNEAVDLNGAGWPGELRPYQVKALDKLGEVWDGGRARAWVVLPPGTGKTLVGL